STREAAATAEGNGPLEALDAALRRALAPHLPWLDEVRLADHSVRVLDAVADGSTDGFTDSTALTRVLVVSRDAEREWTTTGVHASVVVAAMQALTDALAHKALRAAGRPRASVPAS
ncbi:citramalate synthase, partial [Streptomyces sp. SID625]|nr:citramalate synthase [Streptomyces sp. SID625]